MRIPQPTKQRRRSDLPRPDTRATGCRWPATSGASTAVGDGSWRNVTPPSTIVSTTVPPHSVGGSGSWLPVTQTNSAASVSRRTIWREATDSRSPAARSWKESPSAMIRRGAKRATTSASRARVTSLS